MLQFSFYNSLIKFTWKQYEKKQGVSKNIYCHFLLVIVISIMLIYKDFFKNTKMSWVFLRIDFKNQKMLIFHLFQKLFDVIPR